MPQADDVGLENQHLGSDFRSRGGGDQGKKDHFGRIIGKISVDHQDGCLDQIRRGMAWHYKQYARDQVTDDRLHKSSYTPSIAHAH